MLGMSVRPAAILSDFETSLSVLAPLEERDGFEAASVSVPPAPRLVGHQHFYPAPS